VERKLDDEARPVTIAQELEPSFAAVEVRQALPRVLETDATAWLGARAGQRPRPVVAYLERQPRVLAPSSDR
jgi:hypothetical protein